jgi:hypothetical protein
MDPVTLITLLSTWVGEKFTHCVKRVAGESLLIECNSCEI